MAATLEAAPPDAPGRADPPGRRRRGWAPLASGPMPDDRALSWVATGFVTAVAALIRLWGIGFPPAMQFDEIYYATEGAEMLRQGYENNPGYMFIVHPPLGKWLIAAGIAVFGDGPVGWRVPAAVAGTVCVAILVRLVRRMTRSTLLGCVAGILLAVDGLSVVQSRFALLDIFLAVFVLAGFACLVVDRDQMRDRMRDQTSGRTLGRTLGRLAATGTAAADAPDPADTGAAYPPDTGSAYPADSGGPAVSRLGPRLGPRPWRVAAGVLLGLACGVKWSAIWFLAGFALLSVLWDLGARRSAGLSRPVTATAARDLPGAIGALGLAPVLAYVATWAGWFLGENSYGRHWADGNEGYWSWLPGPLRSLLHYHWQMWEFHSGLTTPHGYQSSPWGWLVTGRPVLFYYPSDPSPTGCGAQTCVRTVLDVGTPALWWAFAPAVLWAGWIAVTRRDWRGWAVLTAFGAGWLAWFAVPGRTMFLFYMTPLVPFLVIGVTLALGALLGSVRSTERRRTLGLVAVCVYVATVVINSVWLWPILSGQLITYEQWQDRIWFPSWI